MRTKTILLELHRPLSSSKPSPSTRSQTCLIKLASLVVMMIIVLSYRKAHRNTQVLALLVRRASSILDHLSRTNQLLDRKHGISREKTTTKKVSEASSAHHRPRPFGCLFEPVKNNLLTIHLVERRRREVINEGIENIAKMIPSTDKNKGAVLQNACRYISDLQAKIKDFDNERRLFEVAQQELVSRNNSLRDNAERAWSETQKWMNRCRDAGLQFDDYDAGLEGADLDEAGTAHIGGMSSAGETAGFNVGMSGVDKVDNAVP